MAMALDLMRCEDDSFGPTVHNCRGDFDFTLLFEQSFLSITPSSLLIILSICRICFLRSRSKQVAGTILWICKIATITCYAAVQLSLLVLWSATAEIETRTGRSACALSFIAAIFLAATSWYEHTYSWRPSPLLSLYLLLSTLFDAVQTRTLWLLSSDVVIASLFTTGLAAKIILLVLENVEKDKFLLFGRRDRSPEETSGIFSQSLLLWLARILRDGGKRVISMTDLYTLDHRQRTSPLANNFWQQWLARPSNTTARVLPLAIFRSLKWPSLAPILPRLAQTGFTICQPFLLGQFLRYLQDPPSTAKEATGYGFIAAYALTYIGMALSACFYWRLTYRCLVQMRGCLVAAIYKKTMEIDPARCDMGAPISLMSTDLERIIQGVKDFHEIWANIIQVALSIWLLYREIGIACVAPAVIAIICSVGSLMMSSSADNYQAIWMEATQRRVGMIINVIFSMKSIKFLGLTEKMEEIVESLRAIELRSARRFRYIEVLTATISFAPLLLSPVFTILIFVLRAKGSGQALDLSKLFITLSLLQLMTQPLVWLFQAIPLLVASVGCLRRIGDHLLAQSQTDKRDFEYLANCGKTHSGSETADSGVLDKPSLTISGSEVTSGIVIRNGEFGWIKTKPVLKDVNINIPASKLTIVIGPVASGKTTLCRAIIGELPCSEGEICLASARSSIAYCDQNPFLINSSVQQNILGFSLYDVMWYNSVIDAVALTEDFAALPERDRTRCGSKGITLSGGQRQRLAIARAVYARASLAIFDDALSGLDAITKDHVFEKVFSSQGLLRQHGCTVVLCTHEVNLLPRADHIVVLGTDGGIIDSGSYEQMTRTSEYIKSLSAKIKLDANVESRPRKHDGAQDKLRFQDGDQVDLAVPEDQNRRIGDPTIYKYFLQHIGLWRLVVFAFFQCGWAAFSTIGPVWLNFWSAANAIGLPRNGYHLGVYAALQTLALVFLALFASHTLTSVAVKAGTELHSVILKTLMAAPMSFFSTVDAGATTNRFSQDIILVDGDLPMALLETVSAGLVALVQLILVAVASPYIAIAYPFVIGILYTVQRFYLRTSRQLRFLDLEAKSPLYTHFMETIEGLATIRAFGWSDANVEINHDLLDESQRPLYLLYMVQRWLQLLLDLLTAIITTMLVAIATRIGSTSSGFIGVALINLMSINQELKMIVINWTSLETSLGAIARIKSFEENTPSEHLPGEERIPAKEWPHTGDIYIDSISGYHEYLIFGVSIGLLDLLMEEAV